jgi:hypothetical protein
MVLTIFWLASFISLLPQFYQISFGGRNTLPLTEKQIAEVKAYAQVLNIPTDCLFFSNAGNTAYANFFGDEIVRVGYDVAPLTAPPVSGITANSRISIKGSLAHEWIGHGGARRAGHHFDLGSPHQINLVNNALEEAQASIRAARFAPSLSSVERYVLLRDGIARLKKNNLKIKQVRHLLFINRL